MRGKVCDVFGCCNYEVEKNARSFFRFPRDKNMCDLWVLKCHRSDLDKVYKKEGTLRLYKNYKICSDHFQASDFRNPRQYSQGLRMNPGADRLPAEVLVKIFSHLPCEDLVNSVQFVCIWWQQVSWDKELWKYITYQPDGRYENVIRMLKLSPQLRILNLIFAPVDNNLVQFITDSCPNLEHLHVLWDSIYSNSVVTITRPVSQIKILSLFRKTDTSLDFPYLDRAFPNLESLSIFLVRFNKKDLEHFLQKKGNTLHTLSIPCLTADNLCVLPCLSVCTKLRNFGLYGLCDKVSSWKEVEYLLNISHLTLYCSSVNDISPVFRSFPNIAVLVLHFVEVSESFFCVIARYCPQLQKLKLFQCFGSNAHEDTLHALNLERLTHLCISRNKFLTDEGVKRILQLMPGLIHLDLYQCELLTAECLKFICGTNKLEVLKFDLSKMQPLPELKACDVKNKNLQIMVYNSQDDSYLDTMRQQHLRVCMASYSFCCMEKSSFIKRSSWLKHRCFWCT